MPPLFQWQYNTMARQAVPKNPASSRSLRGYNDSIVFKLLKKT